MLIIYVNNLNRKPTETTAGKSSLFKRMNCFKPQNSEENPLILNKGQISGAKSLNSLKANDVTQSPSQQLQQQRQQEPLSMSHQLMQQHLQTPLDFQEQSHVRIQDYQDEIDQHNYEFYLNQLQNAQNFGQLMRENDRRMQQGGQPTNRLPSNAGYFPPQAPDVYYRPSINVCISFICHFNLSFFISLFFVYFIKDPDEFSRLNEQNLYASSKSFLLY